MSHPIPLKMGLEQNNQATYAQALLTKWRVLLFCMVILLLCYISALVTPYGCADDYAFLVISLNSGRGEAPLKQCCIVAGRPTYGLLIELAFHYIHDIGDLRYLRLLSIVSMTFLAWCLYRTLVLAGWSDVHSLLLSLIVVLMPAFQVYVTWTSSCFVVYAALASSGAFALAERAFTAQGALHRWKLAAGAILLMLIALTIYQPTAMFFWVFAAVVLSKPHLLLSDIVRRFLWYSIVCFVGSILGFGIFRWGIALYGHLVPPTRSHLTHDVLGKVLWFFQEPLTNALNFAQISPKPWLALTFAAFIGGGLFHYFHGKLKERLMRFLIALVILPLSYLPNLIIAENWASYRTQSALTSVLVVYTFLALWGYRQLLQRFITDSVLTVTLTLSVLTSGFLAWHNTTIYFAAPQLQELQYLRSQLVQRDVSQIPSIYIIGAAWHNSLAPTVRYDEFGLPSSAQPWAPKPMVYLLLREMRPERMNIPIELVLPSNPINPPPDALVIDMRNLGGRL